MRARFPFARTVFVLLVVLGAGCASARISQREIDSEFRNSNYDEAIASLEAGLEKVGDEGADRLLYLMDLGIVHHTAGHFQKSIDYLLQADRLSEVVEYVSLSEEAATFLVSDNVKPYRGEDFEHVLISTFLALNFSALGNIEDALVEARRVNRKLRRMVDEGGRTYKQNAFARYLSGVLYEAAGEYDSAYIDYKKAYELKPDFSPLGRDLWRMAFALKRPEEAKNWSRVFDLKEADFEIAKSNLPSAGNAELIVVFENGISPEKRPHPSFNRVPKFYPRPNPVSHAKVLINEEVKAETVVLDDIESTAILNLDEKYAGIVAKKLAGALTKEAVGVAVERGTDSPLLGLITRIALHAADQADLRSWKLLPRDLQISRLVLPPGEYQVEVRPEGDSARLPHLTVEVRAGKKRFLYFRYVPGS